jgi:hypothetical protein
MKPQAKEKLGTSRRIVQQTCAELMTVAVL